MKSVLFILLITMITGCSTEERGQTDADQDIPEAESVSSDLSKDADRFNEADLGEQIARYATSLERLPYKQAGRDTSGFDCSGFVYYVYKQHQLNVPHSSRHLAEMGTEVDTSVARPGDLVFFKGTNPDNPEVGHVGIVVSKPGNPLKFIHASSATSSAYVKYDSLARPNYNRRFIKVKRLIDSRNQLSK